MLPHASLASSSLSRGRDGASAGPLPTDWTGLSQLVDLDVSHNDLTGALPTWGTAQSWPHLRNLDVSQNWMSGRLMHYLV